MKRFRLLSLSVVVAMLSTVAAGPVAVAASAPAATNVVEREIVQSKLSPTGEQQSSRVYSQLTVTGDGTYSVADPTSTDSLRNLSGFGRPPVEDGKALWNLEVDGQRSVRTVADYNEDLPLEITAAFTLDGEPIDAGELVGRSGTLTATYTVRNVSATPVDVEYKDGTGLRQTESVDLPLPLAGSFSATLPPTFTDVVADGGVVAGDGRGGTKLSWSLIMFAPLGDIEQTISYTANVRDAVVPAAAMQAVPVGIEQTPLKSGDDAFSDAADSTFELTQGAVTIDRNVLRLATGAGQLLDGLTKLAEGAAALSAGLNSAADGSGQLADGLVKADDGGRRLGDGLNELSAGAVRLANGLQSADAGGAKLSAGLGQLEAGTGKLSAGLSDASAGSERIAAGAGEIAAGNEAAASGAGQILTGLRKIEAGLQQLDASLPAAKAGAETLLAGVTAIRAAIGAPGQTGTVLDGLSQLAAGLPVARGGVDQVRQGLIDADPGLVTMITNLAAQASLLAAIAADPACDATCQTRIVQATAINTGVSGGLTVARSDLSDAADGLGAVSGGLTNAIGGVTALQTGMNQIAAGLQSNDPANPGIREGLQALVTGLTAAVSGVGQLSAGTTQAVDGQRSLKKGLDRLADGAGQLAAGSDALSGGLGQLDAGGRQLADGMSEAAAGSAELSDGLGQLSDGGGQLADGAGRAATGAGELSGGLGQLREGGDKLASGLGDAADGGGQLADGLGLAKVGGGQVATGARDLSTRGTSVLAESVADANAEQNRNVAMIRALAERGSTDGMPVGAPENADATGVYSFELAAADSTGRESMTRLIVAAFAIAALGGLALLRRRLLPL